MKITHKFYLRSDGETNKPLPIYLQITTDRKTTKRAIGYSCLESDWLENKCQSKSSHATNSRILSLKQKLADMEYSLEKGAKPMTLTQIADIIFDNEKLEVFLLDYFKKYVEHSFATKRIKKGAKSHYSCCLDLLKTFVKTVYKRDDIAVKAVDLSFIKAFDAELHKNKLKVNTINGNYHKKLKAVLNSCIEEDIIATNPYSKFKLITEQTLRVFLSEEEMFKLKNNELGDNESLKIVRDIFLFSCYTGLRFEDAKRLSIDDIQNNGENYFIYRMQNKTGESINIPLSNFALEIINRYDNDERKVTGKVLPQRSNQKINTYLKAIANLVGITKTLTHHVARHTCATMLLNRGVPMDIVQKTLGHNSPKTTSLYAKMSSKTVENHVLKAMNGFETSENLEEKKTGKK